MCVCKMCNTTVPPPAVSLATGGHVTAHIWRSRAPAHAAPGTPRPRGRRDIPTRACTGDLAQLPHAQQASLINSYSLYLETGPTTTIVTVYLR